MSKGLEAFKRIKSYFNPKQLLTKEKTLNDLDTIENELKDKEDYDELCKWFGATFPQLREALVLYKTFDIKKSKKREQALEIIKKHKLLNYIFKNEKCANMYHLSKEEIELLKEVLK